MFWVFDVHLKSISGVSRPKYLICKISLLSQRNLKTHLIFSPSYESSWPSAQCNRSCNIVTIACIFYLPHLCYMVLSVVFSIILLFGWKESPFSTFASNDAKVNTLEWTYGPYNRFYSNHFSQVRNKHTLFKQRVLRLLSESGQN